MTTTKKILLGSLAAVVLFAIYGAKRATELAAVFQNMTIEPNSLPKKIKTTLQTLSFNMDFLLTNASNEDFAVSGYIATLKLVKVYYKNVFLGFANVNIDTVSVPSNDTIILHDLPIQVPIRNVVNLLNDLLEFDFNQMTFKAIIEVAGTQFEIGE
jgi:hypothetical protein